MRSIITHLSIIVLFCLVAVSQDVRAATDPCFYTKNQSSQQCRHYAYDKVDIFFRDAANVEQKVIAKRVKSKTTGELLHVNYDFVVTCAGACGATGVLAREVMWAFRNALVENRLYTKEVVSLSCDPTLEVCCDDTGCSEIFEASGDKEELSQDDTKLDVIKSRNKITIIERAIHGLSSATTIHNNIAQNSRNEAEYQQQCIVEKVFVDMPTFAYFEVANGSYRLCKLSANGECAVIDGRMIESEHSGFAEFTHQQGPDFNEELRSFVIDFYMRDRGMFCNQNMSCDAIGNCSIKLTCQKR